MASFSTSRANYRKKIIICCDGTWQSSVSAKLNVPSNVTRLARRFACNGSDGEGDYAQVVFYDSGVGTGDIGLQSVVQGGTGTGLDTNVIEAYNFIVLNYNPGDKIYCFGFSRGAYTARCVAGLVTDIGIVKPRDMNEFPSLYELYQKNNSGDEFRNTQNYHDWVQGVPADPNDKDLPEGILEQDNLPAVAKDAKKWLNRPHGLIPQETRFVEVVGVFDTVGSLGIPDIRGIDMSMFNTSYGFHNVRLSPFIKNAYHALALDERRGPFSPTLWYIPYGRKAAQKAATVEIEEEDSEKSYNTAVKAERAYQAKLMAKKEKPNLLAPESKKLLADKLGPFQDYMDALDTRSLKDVEQLLYQVWFPGVHINCGGGSDDILKSKKGDLEQLANITFCWMAEMLRPHLSFDASSDTMFIEERQDAIERARHTKNYGTGATWYLRSALEYMHLKDAPTYEISTANEKGWATGDIVDSYGGVMTIAGAVSRSPGQCTDTNKDSSGKKQPLVKMGHTREFVHPSVAYRMKMLGDKYKPPALKDFENKLVPGPEADKRPVWKWIKKSEGLRWTGKDPKTGENTWAEGPVVIPEWWIYPSKGTGLTGPDKDDAQKSFERLCMPIGEGENEPKGWLHQTRDAVYQNSQAWKDALKTHIDT